MNYTTIELDFGSVIIHEDFLIAVMNEGIVFDVSKNEKLLEIGTEVFQGKPYAYISNRINSYAVDPMVYKQSAKFQNLKVIAVVSANDMTRTLASTVEKEFYTDANAFQVFTQLDDAISWVNEKLLQSANHST
ncbi:hypothetical protein [Christiangramia portivictoriae]|uniref:hypothetical protein n=1 Tax=Christiangramia portivictoriae TaxID=326069 RepID=UPI00041AE6AE|nr:hypothetical protein [Christiangramia portivictoriae]